MSTSATYYIRCTRCGTRTEYPTWEEACEAAPLHDQEPGHKRYDTNSGIEYHGPWIVLTGIVERLNKSDMPVIRLPNVRFTEET